MPALELSAIAAELDPPFVVSQPLQPRVPFVFCSPHSGRIYPNHFLAQSRLDPVALRRSEDCYVDELFAAVVGLGAPLIAARFPRAYLDVNREPYELDPQLIREKLPQFANAHSARVVGGLGTIARIVADGESIYRAPLALEAALARIEALYMPFHAELNRLLQRTQELFGYAILIDCHSMPSAPMSRGVLTRPDFVLGDRFGASCDTQLSLFVRDHLAGAGYDVHMNRPYAGGYITEHYGRPSRGWHALQIEMNRGLYLHEQTLEKSAGFDRLANDLTTLASAMFASLPSRFGRCAAAE
ncbi:MAG: N-formylglutamate amidohydrolase [Hyphomicrobiaceae bacterium]|nr:N-formylglutamate amidohydrolase [Hyphomicrobiaceae bacterium]